MPDVETLDTLPAMGGAFARALLPSRTRGARIPERTVRVENYRQELPRLADYSRVCGFTLRDRVPPTWIHVLTFPLQVHLLADPSSSVRLVGAVHVSNRMTMRRPVTWDEPLTLSVRVENLRPHTRGALVDLIGEARVGTEPVWDGVSTYLSTSVHPPGEPERTPREPFTATAPLARWRLPRDLGRHYRRVSGDPNPIHTSRVAARAFGFARPIIHGMWTHARALAALEERLPGAFTARVSFVKPILLPGSVGFAAAATAHGFDAVVTTTDGAKPHLFLALSGAP